MNRGTIIHSPTCYIGFRIILVFIKRIEEEKEEVVSTGKVSSFGDGDRHDPTGAERNYLGLNEGLLYDNFDNFF